MLLNHWKQCLGPKHVLAYIITNTTKTEHISCLTNRDNAKTYFTIIKKYSNVNIFRYKF